MADLFGPDDGFAEDAVPSRDIGQGDELRVDIDDGGSADAPELVQQPRGMPSPPQPTADEIALHWLTHLPYRSWCKWCVAAKKANSPHPSLPGATREIPLLVADYCYVKDGRNEDLLTCFVGRLYPSRALITIPCDVKGVDEYAVERLTDLLRNSGVTRMVHMSDQEKAIGAMIEASIQKLSGSTEWVGSVKETSAVGESQSNGKAEAAVKVFEDHLRVMKGALESRISARIPSRHPVMKWLVEYIGVILNKYAVQSSGKTAYHDLHGKKVSERLAEFGEVVMHYVPKKRRAKLDQRWTTGIFLGTTMHSNETYVALSNGCVVRGRAITRVRPDQRWNRELVQAIRGTPVEPLSRDDSEVESFDNPHDHVREPDRDAPDDFQSATEKARLRTRILIADIDELGPSPGCPRCRHHINKDARYANTNHTEHCRLRMYKLMEKRFSKKNLLVPEIVQAPESDPTAEIDADVLEELISADSDVIPPPTPVSEPEFDNVDTNVVDDVMEDLASGHGESSNQFGMDVDMLLAMGVTPADACNMVIGSLSESRLTRFYEFYGRGGLSEEASKSPLGVKGLGALDFACPKADGSFWDFSRPADRQEALKMVELQDPDWIVGSPPCTAFSVLNHGMNFPKMPPEEVKRRVNEGMRHIKFVVKLYKNQMRRGKWFVHEHPRSALSWKTRPIVSLMKKHGATTTVCHQCMFDLKTPGPDGAPALAKKPTRWMTNSPEMIDVLSIKRDGSHKHQPLMGGRAAAAAFYPPKLLRAIIQGMARTRDRVVGKMELAKEGINLSAAVHSVNENLPRPNIDEPDQNSDKKAKISSIPLHGGGKLPIAYEDQNFKAVYKDEYTGEVLPTHLVRAAMEEELEYFNSCVWEAVDRKSAEAMDGHKLVRMRWVICNKGDEAEYDVRARLVACEVNTFKTDEYFASTPPLEAKRLLFSEFARTVFHPDFKDKNMTVSFVDVKKAYFNGRPRRNLHLVFPKELGVPSHFVAHLNRCVYGTRDAGAIWEDCYADALQGCGFTRGVANPCCFYHADRNLMVVVHGDDFTAVGAKADILWYEDA